MKVLVADGDSIFRRLLKKFVEAENSGDTLWEAEDGEQAIMLAREIRPDLVLMDIALPRVSGFEAAHVIKEEHPEARVVILSMLDRGAYRRAARSFGADTFVAKADCRSFLRQFRRYWSKSPPARKPAPATGQMER